MESTTVQQGETPLSLKPPCVAASAGGSLSLIGYFYIFFWDPTCHFHPDSFGNEAFLLPRCPTGLLSGVGPCYRSALAQPLLQVAMETASTLPGFGMLQIP